MSSAGPDPAAFREGSGRLELARAITDRDNPLTARVLVNRVWMYHFGAGLVRTPGDFGTRAEPPSHPELLDWLADRFVSEGWSLKRLHRQILLSATYQQSAGGPEDSSIRELALHQDPENRWLWHMPMHRLSFEELRDALLAVTGEIDASIGGRPVDLLKAPFPTRRTLYGEVDREDLPSVFRAFDFANPDSADPESQGDDGSSTGAFLSESSVPAGPGPGLGESGRDEDRAGECGEGSPAVSPRLPERANSSSARGGAGNDSGGERGDGHQAIPTARDWQYGYGRYDAEIGTGGGFPPSAARYGARPCKGGHRGPTRRWDGFS